MFQRILVPLDRTRLAPRELEAARALARSTQAHVHVLRILGDAASLDKAEVELDGIEDETLRLSAEVLDVLAPDLSADRIHTEVRSGPVLTTILAAAEDVGADLVIVGSHGRHRPLEWLTGGTAEQLVDRAQASVMVVKPEGYPFLRE